MAVIEPGINIPNRATMATTLQEFTIPSGADYVKIRPIAAACQVRWVGGTDGGAVGTSYETFAADVPEWRAVHGIGPAIWVAGTGSAICEVTFTQRGK